MGTSMSPPRAIRPARAAALTLDGGEQGGLFAADKGAGPFDHLNVRPFRAQEPRGS